MAVDLLLGLQWGDEGKGKIVDWLSEKADVIVRFQGGHNAGHTLVVNKVTYKLKLLPSGIVRKNKISIIGNGVVIDPWALLEEINQIEKLGIKITSKNLYIAENATLILPLILLLSFNSLYKGLKPHELIRAKVNIIGQKYL